MSLAPIPFDIYANFATKLFERYDKNISLLLIETVYKQFEGYTWFIQMMMNELFALTSINELCDVDKLQIARQNVIQSQEYTYNEILSNLSHKQKILLQAIAKEGIAERITSAKFIKKHNLSSASSIQAALKPLLENDLLTQTENRYRVYDYFFSDWLKNEF